MTLNKIYYSYNWINYLQIYSLNIDSGGVLKINNPKTCTIIDTDKRPGTASPISSGIGTYSR